MSYKDLSKDEIYAWASNFSRNLPALNLNLRAYKAIGRSLYHSSLWYRENTFPTFDEWLLMVRRGDFALDAIGNIGEVTAHHIRQRVREYLAANSQSNRELVELSNNLVVNKADAGPDWRDLLTERQRKQVDFARVYAADFAHGANGHNDLLLITLLSELLDKVTQP